MSGIRQLGCLNIMKHLKIFGSPVKDCPRALWLIAMLFVYNQGFGQNFGDYKLDRMPADLETDFALSSLPPRLRDGATVYLLNPTKGYYMTKQGTNGFSVLVVRTQWERAEFLPDQYTSISYDAEMSKLFLPVWFDAADFAHIHRMEYSMLLEKIFPYG
jgi:hypothetical protein